MSNQNENKVEVLPVMEAFYTVQGEGKYAGTAAYFIRLGGCDVGCVWCDVKESWDADVHPKETITEIVTKAKQYPAPLVVITGGEPAMYDLTNLTRALRSEGKYVAIETSGAHELRGHFDWVTFSPKKFKAPLESSYSKADELKVIIFNKHDFKWAEEHAEKVAQNCLKLLQPEWDKRDSMSPLIVDYVKENPSWRISLQTHKYLDIP